MDRPYDLLLFGATGFTGQLVAAELARHAGRGSARIAIAGRARDRLIALRDSLPAPATSIGIVLADVKDPASLQAMAARTRVLINTAGPYNWYGEPVVKACLEAGTHYLDITGEPAFVHAM
ncbi:MAG: saccharopine dehydrogenase NADP-binding domain-containing protein, partial [Saprospiraceae bacterium]|nr:saccharopine dehydrogenase NADP-binding domain-containing protein [Saprospiraceae bacterium]